MGTRCDFVWDGERNRELSVYRPCSCGICSKGRRGVAYLSSSNASGQGFTIWIENEEVVKRLTGSFQNISVDPLGAVCTNCNEGLQNTAPPKPDRIELMKQVRRATVDDQLYLLQWLEGKYAKIRLAKK